eukprot:CAMPEP_0204270152 /NCGR_PEP_ID=MMETSP0468-20130131/18311_1 /ASSEMBLY_ACC=CAM_ASM_000383 /TAXON_ID=2969 /ORGANISM="Oxyrrhis marina" /LENGTH=603 /DNA_ID=CAMNT_0051245645 /DNA_START=43 /DNA_END=1854 /DNA_ORIENTATION=-
MAAQPPPFPGSKKDEHFRNMKFVVVTGGSVSGLGKGTAISSMGVVLKAHGLRCTAVKIDPYLNLDAGTMSPFEHGEVYVLDDGAEVDLDLGNYERLLDVTLTAEHSVTSGKIFETVIQQERKGSYLGKTVQMVPHVTDAIQFWLESVAVQPVDSQSGCPDICLVELGGTVGDIESAVYLEALQQMRFQLGPENMVLVHLGLVPTMGSTGEQKTKPMQHSVRILREAGLQPDFLFCRCETPVEQGVRKKISMFCQVPEDRVFSLHDVSNIYRVPLLLDGQDIAQAVCQKLQLSHKCVRIPHRTLSAEHPSPQSVADWKVLADRVDDVSQEVIIGIVGKYTGLQDSYMSVIKALKHACIECGLHLVLEWIESSDLEPNMRTVDGAKYEASWRKLKSVHGILVPGGFGDRGIEGKVLAAKYARESNTPYLGICIGLQIAVIEFARHVVGWDLANSAEFDDITPNPVVIFMPEVNATVKGGTMRLGSRVTIIKSNQCLAYKLYGSQGQVIYERHRHRYEVNPAVVASLESKGLRFTGQDERGSRMEIAELPDHPFYIGVQFHPEFKSRPARPSPPFLGLVLASAGILQTRLEHDRGVLRVGSGYETD